MADFQKSIKIVLENEGIFSKDPLDIGGETCFGISRKFFPKWDGWDIVDSYKDDKNFPYILKNDSKLTEKVFKFYKDNFWNPLLLDKLTNQKVADILFDSAVNIGIPSTLALCNLSTNTSNQQFNLDLIADLNRADNSFIYKFIIYRISRYVYIVKKNPNNKKYFFGWVIRSLKFI